MLYCVFKLIGVDVYNEANEKIGNIEELILDKSVTRRPWGRRLSRNGRALRRSCLR
jgi:hypothetical protein